MPKLKLVVANKSAQWEEEHVTNAQNAKQWAVDLIARFNGSLRPGELKRRLVSVTVVGNNAAHDWEKLNLVTLTSRDGRIYDTARCTRCGITGRRYGLSGITVDSKFRAEKYKECHAKGKL